MTEIPNEGELAETKLADIIYCSVCRGLLNDAKLLQCGHSYCLKCLEDLASKQDVGTAGHLSCPVCRSSCVIPSSGLQSLPPNVYVDTLVQLKQMPTSKDRADSGDECSPTAAGAQLGHKDPKRTSLVRHSAETSAEGKRDTSGRNAGQCSKQKTSSRMLCDQHMGREMTVYCRNCDQAMCEACFIQLHNGHGHDSVDDVATQLRDQLRADTEKMDVISTTNTTNLRALEQQRDAVVANVQVSGHASTVRRRVVLCLGATSVTSVRPSVRRFACNGMD